MCDAYIVTQFCQISRQHIRIFLCIYNNALEYSFLTTAEKLIVVTVRGQLSLQLAMHELWGWYELALETYWPQTR
jgi:hypothetical protein